MKVHRLSSWAVKHHKKKNARIALAGAGIPENSVCTTIAPHVVVLAKLH